MPSISVITVVRNGAATIGELIDSVLAQEIPGLEFIVVDGASTDGTVDILRSYGNRISRWISEPDKGLYDAFNKALALASGDYYVVAGADDRFHPGAFRALLTSGCFDDEPDFLVCDVLAGGRRKSGFHPRLGWIRHNLIVTSHSVGMVIRRSVHRTLGPYPTRFRVLADAVIIKGLVRGPFRGKACPVLMGEFGTGGVSSSAYLDVMWEQFQVQLATERWTSLQVGIFVLRLLKNLRSVLFHVRR